MALNPADIGTRMISPKNKNTFLPWTKGPEFLLLPEQEWPLIPFEKDQVVDVVSLFMLSSEVKSEIDNDKSDPLKKFILFVDH